MESWCDRCPFRGRACRGSLLPGHCPAIVGGEPGGRTTPAGAMAPNPHAARDALVRSCDHRVDAVGLERGDVCGCLPATRCLLRRGKWPDDPCAVDYGDCLSCLS